MVAPSGRQFEIRCGDHVVTVVEVGGGLRTYEFEGRPVLDGYDYDQMCTGARGQQLIPWPNRLDGGRYAWDGQHYRVPLDEPDKGNAIHGLTRWCNWRPELVAPDRVDMSLRLHALPGYPFTLDLFVSYRLDEAGLAVETTALNCGTTPAPYAHGVHPYVTVGTDLIDDALFTLPANAYLPINEAKIPCGRASVAGTEFDFRTPRRLGATKIDHAFTDLIRDRDGCATVTLAAPDGSALVEVWGDENFRYLEVYTGDTLPQAVERRRGLAVEPMTGPPNAFATGEDLLQLDPGESFTTRWGIRPHRSINGQT